MIPDMSLLFTAESQILAVKIPEKPSTIDQVDFAVAMYAARNRLIECRMWLARARAIADRDRVQS